MILIVVIDGGIYLYSDSECLCVFDREHESFPWTWSISEKIMNLRIEWIDRKVNELKSGSGKLFGVGITRTHHSIWYYSWFYSYFIGVFYPSCEIGRERRLTSCKYHTFVVSLHKIIDNFYSFLIWNIVAVGRVGTKVTGIITVSIYLDVSYIRHTNNQKIYRDRYREDFIHIFLAPRSGTFKNNVRGGFASLF